MCDGHVTISYNCIISKKPTSLYITDPFAKTQLVHRPTDVWIEIF